MKIVKLIVGCLSILLTVMTLSASDVSDAQDQTMIVVSDAQVMAGQTAVIQAEIDCSVAWCGEVALTLHFDPTFLQVEGLDVGPYFGDQYLDLTDIDNEQGIVSFHATAFQADLANTEDVLFHLNVRPVDLGETIIEVADIQVKDGDENLVEAASISGIVDIDVDVDNLLAVLANYDWKIAFVSERDANPEIYVMNADGSDQTRLTENDARDDMPVWSPDGSQIAFVSERDGNPEIYVMSADGTEPQRLTDDPATDDMPVWSPDAEKIVFVSERDGNRELYIMDADGSNPRRLTENDALDDMPAFSPDGSQIAFISVRDGQRGLYLLTLESGEVVALNNVSDALESQSEWSYPVWSADGAQIIVTSSAGAATQLRTIDVETGLDTPVFDKDVRPDHLTWSRDANWLVYGAEADGAGDISILFIEKEAGQHLTDDAADDYAPDLFDPQLCTVRSDSETVRVRVGPGTDRGIFGSFPADRDIRVIGQATAADGSLWWQLDKTMLEGGAIANSLWVAQDAVESSRRCRRVTHSDAPPIIAVQSNNTTSNGQWGFCGSCDNCGPYPSSECVTSPDGVCLWDPTTCRNVTIVTDPGGTPAPGGSCSSVSLNFRSTTGAPVSPAPGQSVNTAPTCVTGAGFAPGTSVSISTSNFVCSSCGEGDTGYEFDHWEGTCGVSGGSTAAFTIGGSCLATAVYRPVTIIG